MESPSVVDKEVEVSPSPTPTSKVLKKPRAPRQRRRRTLVHKSLSAKKIHRKRPMTTITSFQKYVTALQAEVKSIFRQTNCISLKIREFEEQSDKALKRYNDLKNLVINLVDSGGEHRQNIKWKVMGQLEDEIISIQDKMVKCDQRQKKERAVLRTRHGFSICCRYCADRLPL